MGIQLIYPQIKNVLIFNKPLQIRLIRLLPCDYVQIVLAIIIIKTFLSTSRRFVATLICPNFAILVISSLSYKTFCIQPGK